MPNIMEQLADHRSDNSKRGSVNNNSRLEAFAKRSKVGNADWGTCNPHTMQAVVLAVTKLGGAAMFGLSRDKGAHSLTLLLDGAKQTLWFNGDAVLDDELETVLDTFEKMR